MDMHRTPPASSGELHELGLTAAARAIRNGEVSSEDLTGRLLERARAHGDLNAFITIDEVAVLEAPVKPTERSRQDAVLPCLACLWL